MVESASFITLLLARYAAFLCVVIPGVMAKAYLGYWCGDDSVRRYGRLSWDVRVHVDVLYTLILPLICFMFSSPIIIGSARPLFLNHHAFDDPKRDRIFIASMLLLLYIVGLAFGLIGMRFLAQGGGLVHSFFEYLVYINAFFCTLSLLPLLPFEGGKIVCAFFPSVEPMLRLVERYIFFVFLIFVWMPRQVSPFEPLIRFAMALIYTVERGVSMIF